ncbi:unnamed protein product [Soboliphyme baturini]|uniref:DUF5743 domain-containing protein n=1 Tax=Soboliphyme baturini TaxID=241478 RepID=A0A183IHH5_9BILA|nr:unnamed protein product [Soboliphyme baturini]
MNIVHKDGIENEPAAKHEMEIESTDHAVFASLFHVFDADMRAELTELQSTFVETSQELDKTRNMLQMQYRLSNECQTELNEVKNVYKASKQDLEHQLAALKETLGQKEQEIKESVLVQLHQSIASNYRTLATGEISLKSLLDFQVQNIKDEVDLIGAEEIFDAVVIGTAAFAIEAKIPMTRFSNIYEQLVIHIFDDDAPNIDLSYLGEVAIPLLPLISKKSLSDSFPIKKESFQLESLKSPKVTKQPDDEKRTRNIECSDPAENESGKILETREVQTQTAEMALPEALDDGMEMTKAKASSDLLDEASCTYSLNDISESVSENEIAEGETDLNLSRKTTAASDSASNSDLPLVVKSEDKAIELTEYAPIEQNVQEALAPANSVGESVGKLQC